MEARGNDRNNIKTSHPSLPLTVSMADVFSCPHIHEYSPASAVVRPWICSTHTAPSCLRPYLSPSCKVFVSFFHITGVALLSAQLSVAVAPSVASSFFRPSMNLAGRAGEVRKTQTQSHSLRTGKTRDEDGTGKTGSPAAHRPHAGHANHRWGRGFPKSRQCVSWPQSIPGFPLASD